MTRRRSSLLVIAVVCGVGWWCLWRFGSAPARQLAQGCLGLGR